MYVLLLQFMGKIAKKSLPTNFNFFKIADIHIGRCVHAVNPFPPVFINVKHYQDVNVLTDHQVSLGKLLGDINSVDLLMSSLGKY